MDIDYALAESVRAHLRLITQGERKMVKKYLHECRLFSDNVGTLIYLPDIPANHWKSVALLGAMLSGYYGSIQAAYHRLDQVLLFISQYIGE